MAFKQDVLSRLSDLLKAEDDLGRLLRRQNIYLMMHPKLGDNKASEIRKELAFLIKDVDRQESEVMELLSLVKGSVQDVY